MKCQHCNVEIAENTKFCPACGKKQIDPRKCKKCGAVVAHGQDFCPVCGRRKRDSKLKTWVNDHNNLISGIQIAICVLMILLMFITSIDAPIFDKYSVKNPGTGSRYTYEDYIDSEDYSLMGLIGVEHADFSLNVILVLVTIIAFLCWKIFIIRTPWEKERTVVSLILAGLQTVMSVSLLFSLLDVGGRRTIDVVENVKVVLQYFRPQAPVYILTILSVILFVSTIFVAILSKNAKHTRSHR